MNELGFIVLAVGTFPLAFGISRLCLAGFIRLLGESGQARGPALPR
jgi:hypothetical protein